MHYFQLSLSWLAFLSGVASATPTVTLPGSHSANKTTFVGRSLPEFDQELFLGIKYADEPVRFTPSSLKTTYSANDSDNGLIRPSSPGNSTGAETVLYNATQYGYECPGYGSDETKLIESGVIEISEDCLNLNVIRPTGDYEGELLPVLKWTTDYCCLGRYNMTYITRQAALNGKPILGVSINYRLAAFGFLDSEEIRTSGNNNLGLLDQRVAMRWMKNNIEAFGGDPDKITIWGESAGAYSVGAHLVANGGDNEGLFRAAIMESGNAVGPPWNGTDWYQPMYDRIVERAGCSGSTDTLQCLRDLPFDTLYDAAYEGLEWFAAVDGKFISEYPQISITKGRLVKVPILLGSNTDEGVSFGTTGVDTDEDCIAQLISSKRWVLNMEQATELIKYYPNDPIGSPYGWGNVTWPEKGLMYKRYSSVAGDITMAAPRRLLAQAMSEFEENVYSYRWDIAAINETSNIGVNHFAEIPFVFANPIQNFTTLGADTDSSRLDLANLAARMWSSFVTDLDPNGHGVDSIPLWPAYRSDSEGSNFVFRLPKEEIYVETDDYRAQGVEYINSIPR
ncbi:carboxylesterase family protein [Aspergillus venezuelensis]